MRSHAATDQSRCHCTRVRTATLRGLVGVLCLASTSCLASLDKHYTTEANSRTGPPIESTREAVRETQRSVRFGTTGIQGDVVRGEAVLVTACRSTSKYEVDVSSTWDRSLNGDGKTLQWVNVALAAGLATAGTLVMVTPCKTDSGAACPPEQETTRQVLGAVTIGTSLIPAGFLVANAVRTGKRVESQRSQIKEPAAWSECQTEPYIGAILVEAGGGEAQLVQPDDDGRFRVRVPQGATALFVSAQGGVQQKLDIEPLVARQADENSQRLQAEAQRSAEAAEAQATAEREARKKEVAAWPTVSVDMLVRGVEDITQLATHTAPPTLTFRMTEAEKVVFVAAHVLLSCRGTPPLPLDHQACAGNLKTAYGKDIELVSISEAKVAPKTLADLKKVRAFVEAHSKQWAEEDYRACYAQCLREKAFATAEHCNAVCRK